MSRGVVLSDLHVGSVVGLWPGAHRVEGGGSYECNKYQLWLYRCWQKTVELLEAMAPLDYIIVNGDSIQGVNRRDGELITTQINIQVEAAVKLLEPVRACTERFYAIRGTEWHEGKAADFAEMLFERLDSLPDPNTGQRTRWDMYLDIANGNGERVVHVAHHIGTSSVPWYEATVPLRDTLMLIAEMSRFGGPNVRAVVRSHRHRFIHVDAPPDINAIVTPAYQLKTAFAHKRASAMLPQIGFVILEWDGQDLLVRKRLFELPPWQVERLK